MKILLTGHKGYIGSRLDNKLLDLGHTVYYLNQNIIYSDLPEDIDIVYHLAAHVDEERSWREPFWDVENILSTLKIAQAYAGKKIIYTSSISAIPPFNSPYGVSKRAGEDYIKLFCKQAFILQLPGVGDENIEQVLDELLAPLFILT